MKYPTYFRLLIACLLVGVAAYGCSPSGQNPATPTSPPAAPYPENTTAAPETQVTPADSVPTPSGPRLLRVGATNAVTTWDPIESFSTEALYLANVYEPLLRINPPHAAERFTPLLAERWESSADGLVWTFYLRPNVRFHDGERLTAEAVKLSIETAADRGGASFIWAPLDRVEVVDELTVRLRLDYPAPLDLIASSLYGAWIVSPRALAAAAEDEGYFEAGVAVGTGPYRLERYTPDEEVILARFDDYWGGWRDANHFDQVQIAIIADQESLLQKLTAGEVDLVTRIPQQEYTGFSGRAGYQLLFEPAFFNYVGFFNTLRPPLDDPLVRQALAYAIPYQEIIDVGVLGYGAPSRGPVPAGLWPYSGNVYQYSYDPEQARALLAEAGYPDGGFSLRLTYAAENEIQGRFAPLIVESFARLGVAVEIESLPFNQQWAEARNDPENAQDIFLLLYWPTYSDAGTDNLAAMFQSSERPFFNLSYWRSEEFDALVDEAGRLTATDSRRAQQLYEQAMNLLVDEAPGLFFFDTQAIFVIPEHIQGFEYNLNYPFATFFFYALRQGQ